MTAPPTTKPQFAGMSILERCWQELDDIMNQLMSEELPAVWSDEHVRGKDPSDHIGVASEWMARGELRGQAQGVAYCIAMITNPYEPDVPAIKKEARQRWDARQD